MNRTQRAVLIVGGLLIAGIQLLGIIENGLEDSRGWAVALSIAALLLFLGFGTWSGIMRLWTRARAQEDRPIPAAAAGSTETPPRARSEYGIHISELDLAIGTATRFAEDQDVYHPLQGRGKSLHWASCVLIYAAMRYAARKTKMTISAIVWNTIVRSIVVRMTTEGERALPTGSIDYKAIEEEAYQDIKWIDEAVEDGLRGKGDYAVEPIVRVLVPMFGARGDGVKAISAGVVMFGQTAYEKIIPELLETFS